MQTVPLKLAQWPFPQIILRHVNGTLVHRQRKVDITRLRLCLCLFLALLQVFNESKNLNEFSLAFQI